MADEWPWLLCGRNSLDALAFTFPMLAFRPTGLWYGAICMVALQAWTCSITARETKKRHPGPIHGKTSFWESRIFMVNPGNESLAKPKETTTTRRKKEPIYTNRAAFKVEYAVFPH